MERQMAEGTFTRVDNYIFKEGKFLTAEAKLVYVVLCSYRNNKTGKTCPSYDKIRDRSGLSRNKVAAALNELEHFHWVSRKKVFKGGNHYHVSWPVDNEYKLPSTCPTEQAAKQYAQMIKDTKPRYGTSPWDSDAVEEYDDPEELDDDQIPF
ncbi:MAG: Helix-turn-helix domain [Acidobacteriota bacterium]|jgi:predicted transcriptional regulator|nr:Helix-turn-helix domain [Acidobacteriota bacterium]